MSELSQLRHRIFACVHVLIWSSWYSEFGAGCQDEDAGDNLDLNCVTLDMKSVFAYNITNRQHYIH